MTAAAGSVDHRREERRPLEVPDIIANSARRFPDRTCVSDGTHSWTFAEVSDRASRGAAALCAAGLEPGDRVGLLAKNELSYLEVQIAAQRAGVVLVPLNFRLTPPELQYILDDSSPRLLIASEEFLEVVQQLDAPPVWALDCAGAGYEAAVEEAVPATVDRRILGPDPFFIQYTSGTTGHPKGAVISNQAQWARIVAYSLELGIKPGDVFLQPLPMFHIAYIINHAFAYRGGTSVLMRDFDPEHAIDLMRRTSATHLLAVPTMMTALCDVANPLLDDLGMVLYGASPASPTLLSRAMELWPHANFMQFYGATEAGMVTNLRPVDHQIDKPGQLASAGKEATGCSMAIVDDSGEELGTGVAGEIVARGPSLMDGYWRNEDATANAFDFGWLRTGDMAYFDEAGYVHVTDRKNDMIISGGENVYPTEVENVLYEFAGVREVAVVGIPHEVWGEQVHASVALAEGVTATAHQLREHCRSSLAGYKVPKSIEIVMELPKNATGKILRRTVRDEYAARGAG